MGAELFVDKQLSGVLWGRGGGSLQDGRFSRLSLGLFPWFIVVKALFFFFPLSRSSPPHFVFSLSFL